MLRRLRSEGSAASPDTENNNTRKAFPSSSSSKAPLSNTANRLQSRNQPNSQQTMMMKKPPNSASKEQPNTAEKDFLASLRQNTANVDSPAPSPLPKPIANEIQLISNTIVRCDDRIQMSKTWERRHDALLRAKELFLQNPQIATCTDFLSAVTPLREGLNAQLVDIRSQIAKEACNVVDSLVSCAAGTLGVCEVIVDWFLGTLLHLASNTAAVVSNASSDCVKKICIRGRINRDGLTTIYKFCNDKQGQTRTEAYSALLMILHFAVDKNLLTKQLTSISLALRHGFMDKLPAIRLRARITCWALDAISHEAAVNLLAGCDVSLKKSVLDEEPTYALWISRGIEIFNFSCEDAIAARKQGLTPADFAAQQHHSSSKAAMTSSSTSHPMLKRTGSNVGNASTTSRHHVHQTSENTKNNSNNAESTDIVTNFMSVFGSPTMKAQQDAAVATKKQQQQQLADATEGNEDDDWLLSSPKNTNKAGGGVQQSMNTSRKVGANQNDAASSSKWSELALDYADSDWKHRVEVLSKVEGVILGEDKTAGSKNSSMDNHQVKIELPGSGTYTVEAGGSLLALAEVLYDSSSSGTMIKSVNKNNSTNTDEDDANALSPNNNQKRNNKNNNSASSAVFHSHQQPPPPQLSSLPAFFRNDSSNAKPEEVVDLVLKGVEDVNPKVCLAGLSSLTRLVERSPVMLATSLEKTFKILFQKLGDMKEQVRSRAVEVLTLMRRRIQSDRIVPVLLGKILDLVQHRVRLACLEYLHSGIPFFDSYFQSSIHMRASLSRIVAVSQKVHNLDITHATIACMARLAERHRELFVTSLMSMDGKDQTKIVSALSTAVPYLTQDLRRKANRDPLLLQSSPDTSLNYALFLAPGENSKKGTKPLSASTNNNSTSSKSVSFDRNTATNHQDAAASPTKSEYTSPLSSSATSTIIRGGQVPSRLSQRMQDKKQQDQRSSSLSGVNSHHQDRTKMLMSSRSSTSPVKRRSLSPRSGNKSNSTRSYFEKKKEQFASEILHPADANNNNNKNMMNQDSANGNGDSTSSNRQQQQQSSWFVSYKSNPPSSVVQQWASDRKDPPAIVALASAVTSEDKLKALNELENADASVWLDNFGRVAPFPIALCVDNSDHRVRSAAIRCTKLVMTAPALVSQTHHHSDGGILESAVRNVTKCLADSFPEVRSDAIACLNESFARVSDIVSATSKNNNKDSSFGYSLLNAMLTVCVELTSSSSTRSHDNAPLIFMIKNLGNVYFRGLAPTNKLLENNNLRSFNNNNNSHHQSTSSSALFKSTTRTLLPNLCQFLIETFSHDSPDIRKLVVNCFVELLVGADDEQELMKNFIGLGSAQMRLIDIYWNRSLDISNPMERKDLTKRMKEYGFTRSL